MKKLTFLSFPSFLRRGTASAGGWLAGVVLIALLLSSCLTVSRIEKNCDKFAKVCVTESVTKIEYRDTTIYKDRIIEVKLPNDTVYLTKNVYIKENMCFMDYTRKTFGNIWASAKVENSILDLRAGYVSNIVQVPIHDTIYIERAISNTTTDNTVVLPPEKYIPKFYKFTFWVFIVSLIAALVYISWSLFFKSRIKKFFP
jgi:hypothetical protein